MTPCVVLKSNNNKVADNIMANLSYNGVVALMVSYSITIPCSCGTFISSVLFPKVDCQEQLDLETLWTSNVPKASMTILCIYTYGSKVGGSTWTCILWFVFILIGELFFSLV